MPPGPFDVLATVLIPLGVEATANGPVLRRVLAGMDGSRVGWLEVLQSGTSVVEGEA
jgi:hypothetical protein